MANTKPNTAPKAPEAPEAAAPVAVADVNTGIEIYEGIQIVDNTTVEEVEVVDVTTDAYELTAGLTQVNYL